jgi:DNA-binding PadR family transcriptional regulator
MRNFANKFSCGIIRYIALLLIIVPQSGEVMFNKYPFSSQTRPDVPFRRGLFKYVVLQYLQEKPCHGYEIIQALSKRFHGFYIPSPGSIYPRLWKLENEGYVTYTQREGRKVYTIAEKGLRFLAENSELEKEINARLNDWENPENIDDIRKTMHEFARLGEMLSWEVRKMSPEKLRRVRDVLSRAHSDVESILEDLV